MTNTDAKDLSEGLREVGDILLHFENQKKKEKKKSNVIGRRSLKARR